jgi:hypothetical protein
MMRTHRVERLGFVIALVSAVVLSGCAGAFGKIRKVDSPTENELRTAWKEYHAFCLTGGYRVSSAGSAILFQVKDGKNIRKSGGWQEVTDEKTAAGCAGFANLRSPVLSLLGENDATFGYLIYDYRDGVSVTVIDANTISLNYFPSPKTGGP